MQRLIPQCAWKPEGCGQGGFGLIEIIVVTAVIVTTLAAFSQTGILAVRALRSEKVNLEMVLLAQEGLEAARAIRDEEWGLIASSSYDGTLYYPVVEEEKWKLLTTAPSPINDRYTRTVRFGAVCRDSVTQRINPPGSPCTISSDPGFDPESRKVTVEISDALTNKQRELVTYLTNFREFLAEPTVREEKVLVFEGNSSADLAHFPSDNTGEGDPAQSITPLSDIRVTRIELRLRRMTSSPSNISAEIWGGAQSQPLGGTLLGVSDNVITATLPFNTAVWVEFRFTQPIPLNILTKYYIRLRSHPSSNFTGSGSSGTIYWLYKTTAASPYLGGEAWISIEQDGDPISAVEKSLHDFSFRVYAIVEE